MVSIIPGTARTAADLLGQQVAQSLQQNFQPAYAQGLQRQRGYQAIDRLQQDLSSANGDISKILPAIARAYTDNPNLERSGIAQYALQQARANVSPTISQITGQNGQQGQQLPAFLGGMLDQQQNPQQQLNQQSNLQQQQNQPSATSKGTSIQLGSYLPYNLGEQITPDQRASILDQVKRAGGDVDFTKQQIDEYNSGKISQTDLANSNVDKQAAQVQKQLGLENQIKQRIDKQLPNATESEKNIYYNMVNKELPNHKDFTSAWQSISNKIDNFRKTYDAYVKSIPEGDFSGLTPEGEKKFRSSAQPLLKQDPLAYNVIEDAFVKKGNSVVTPAKVLNPLPENIQNITKSAGDYRDLIYPKFSFFHEVSNDEMIKNIEEATSKQQDEIPKLSKQLDKNWNENVSLINIFADLKARGWQLNNITSLLDTLSERFSPQQERERALLNEAPRVPIKYLR